MAEGRGTAGVWNSDGRSPTRGVGKGGAETSRAETPHKGGWLLPAGGRNDVMTQGQHGEDQKGGNLTLEGQGSGGGSGPGNPSSPPPPPGSHPPGSGRGCPTGRRGVGGAGKPSCRRLACSKRRRSLAGTRSGDEQELVSGVVSTGSNWHRRCLWKRL